jgi:predicted nuclease with TOPRIM domain
MALLEPRPQPKNTSRNYLLVALLILAFLNILLFYFWFQERQENKSKDAAIAVKTEEVLSARTKLDSISAQLDAKIDEIQRLGGSVDSLIKVREQLERDKAALRNVNEFDSKKFDQKIRGYQSLLAQKDQELTRLAAENGQLSQVNDSLRQENSGLKAERQSLSDSMQSVVSRNQELSEKVGIAAALRAENVTVSAINDNGRERDGESFRAKQIDKLHIAIRLSPNGLARQESKELFLRILDPNGAVISDMATGSGEFTYNNQQMIYTAMQRFDFDNSRQQINFIYGRGGQRFKPGTYTIELYCEGFRIGEGGFTVK